MNQNVCSIIYMSKAGLVFFSNLINAKLMQNTGLTSIFYFEKVLSYYAYQKILMEQSACGKSQLRKDNYFCKIQNLTLRH